MATKKTSKKAPAPSGKKAAKGTSASSPAKKKAKKAVAKAPVKKLTKRQAAKKKSEVRSEVSSISGFIKKIRSTPKYKGCVQIGLASELNVPYRLRRPSGITSLDIAIGGGFHAGGCAQISGADSVGKTALAYLTAGQVQKNYGEGANILVVSTEIRLDKTFARKFGFRIPYSQEEIEQFSRIRELRGEPPYTDEEVADLTKEVGAVVPVTGSTGDRAMDVALEGLEAGIFQLFIIESLGALLTSDQEAGDVGDRTYGGSAPILTNFMNKAYPLFMMDRESEAGSKMLETTIIGINQARAEMDRPSPRSPKTHAAAGAYAWKHAQLLGIELKKGAPIRGSEGGKEIGREVKWSTSKGKVGTHDGKTGTYDYYHVPEQDPMLWSEVEAHGPEWGPDLITDLVETAKKLGLIELSGSWLTWQEGSKVIIKAQGTDNFADGIVNDQELEEKLRRQCFDAAHLSVEYR